VANAHDGRGFDPGTRAILAELRDLRREMRADRGEAKEERRRADEALRQERARSDERFAQVMREFREDSARREAGTQKAFKDLRTDLRTVGLSIVKTLNRNTRILERIDRRFAARGDGDLGRGNGRNA
jgi:hypothetical protein